MIMGVALLIACELDSSDNGDLDGYWQLTRIDTLSTGGSLDMREELMFWYAQHKLFGMRDNSGGNSTILYRFSLTEDSLTLSEPVIDNRNASDIVVDDYSILRPYGIYNIPESFHVDHLSGGSMTLTSKMFRFHFRKY